MGTKDTLFHIEWGDGDDTFVLAPDEATAIERMPDGKDMVNSIVRLGALYGPIYRAGIREVVEWFMGHAQHIDEPSMTPYYRFDFLEHELEPKLREWGIKED